MYKVIGLRLEKYLGTTCSGHNCDFEYGKEERDRHVILLKDVDSGVKVELTLSEEEGECGSGWCTASWGEFDWTEVESFTGKTHTIKEEILLDLSKLSLGDCYEDSIDNEVFYFSGCGGDAYYPSGGYKVDMDLFTPSSD